MLPAIRKNISALVIPQQHLHSAAEANQLALNHYALAIAGRLCSVDGELNMSEKRTFLQLFPYFGSEHLGMLRDTANDNSSVYLNCKRFSKFTNGSAIVAARLYARLFKLACSDNGLNVMEISYLEKVGEMLGLSKLLLEKALEHHFLSAVDKPVKFDAYIDARSYYRNEMLRLHPDMFTDSSVLSPRIRARLMQLANERMRILNENYRKSLS